MRSFLSTKQHDITTTPHATNNQWLFLVPIKGGRDYITPQKAIYKWYILPIGGLYATYHLLGEPETAIETNEMLSFPSFGGHGTASLFKVRQTADHVDFQVM